MTYLREKKKLKYISIGTLLTAYFLYFTICNANHIHYLEETQLFIWSLDFLKEQFSLPGALPLYAGSFFTQFFISSWIGGLIFTLNALVVFILSSYILKKHNFQNIIIALVPVWMLAFLQSNEFYVFAQAIGFLLLLSFFALYISFTRTRIRYIFFFTGWPIFYLLTGGFAEVCVLLCILHELLFRNEKARYLFAFLYAAAGVSLPYLFSRFLYYIQPDTIFTYPVNFQLPLIFKYVQISLLAWTPLILSACFLLSKFKTAVDTLFSWSIRNIVAGSLLIILMSYVVYRHSYNKMADMMLGVDHYAQIEQWDKILRISEKYEGYNTLMIYYTNLALYNTGKLLDNMFDYPQIGSQGLRLRWQRNLNLFFGGEVFSQLSYNNESIHWAFESLVAVGMNPRSLKKLSVGFYVNGNDEIAEKYLSILKKTLFYRKWAQQHIRYLSDTELAKEDPEISHYKALLVNTNFFSEVNGLNLQDLLKNHPNNKMAYEYLIASLLLDRNLNDFASAVQYLKDYGYRNIPVNIEEALVFYDFFENKSIVPEGYSVRQETLDRFEDYVVIYMKYGKNLKVAANELRKKYKKSYWYYLQFSNK